MTSVLTALPLAFLAGLAIGLLFWKLGAAFERRSRRPLPRSRCHLQLIAGLREIVAHADRTQWPENPINVHGMSFAQQCRLFSILVRARELLNDLDAQEDQP